MTRLFCATTITVALLWALPAAAQTPAPAASSAGHMFFGLTGGVEAVQNVGGSFGGEVGYSVTDMIDVFGEATWLQDVVTRRKLDVAKQIATFLQTSQGKTATSNVTAPGFYTGAGARLTLMNTGAIHPYFAIGAGVAHITINPTFTLSGSDVTTSL